MNPHAIVEVVKAKSSLQVEIKEKLDQKIASDGLSAVQDQFNKFDRPRPYVTVIGFAVDGEGRFPIFFRSDKVRSARNAWSMPSGLHEVGLFLEEQFKAELNEELGLEALPDTFKQLGVYEAIVFDRPGEPNWHWVLVLSMVEVKTLATLVNREPEKHSDVKLITLDELYGHYIHQNWTMGLKEALLEFKPAIESAYLSTTADWPF